MTLPTLLNQWNLVYLPNPLLLSEKHQAPISFHPIDPLYHNLEDPMDPHYEPLNYVLYGNHYPAFLMFQIVIVQLQLKGCIYLDKIR